VQRPFLKGEKIVNLLTADHITKSFGERYILKDASFYLHEGEKVGVLGINGTGKSTLLKIMAGLEEPEAGSVIKANHIVTHYLPFCKSFWEIL
jgi:ATP-binding cassette subfamily F protein uup